MKKSMVITGELFGETIKFEKHPTGATVSVFLGDRETDCFTHYGIEQDWEKFESVCQSYIEEAAAEYS